MPKNEWEFTASGNRCAWCAGTDYEPFDSDDADATLCRGHVAEFEGVSLEGLDRWEDAIRADMSELGYFD